MRDPQRRAEWISLVESIEAYISERGLQHEVVFHGTSARKARSILDDGLNPTDAELAAPQDAHITEGSFWGNVRTAAAYAEDTAKERETKLEGGEMGGGPVLIAISTRRLANEADIFPDLATLDFPLKGLTRLEDPQVADGWYGGLNDKDWRDGLDDLGAIVALHHHALDPEALTLVRDIDDLDRLLESRPAPR